MTKDEATERSSDEQPAPVAEPRKQEPVAWVCYGAPGKRDIDFEEADINGLPIGTLLYTSPPAQRKPLTDEEMAKALPRPWPEEDDRVCLSATELRQFVHNIKENT